MKLTALTDPDNVQLRIIDEGNSPVVSQPSDQPQSGEKTGMTTEEAYAYLTRKTGPADPSA